jgi:outer membrane protein
MKKSTLALLFALLTATAGLNTSAQAQDLKVGIVDMNRVFAEYYKTKDAEKRVNEDKSAAKKELDERSARYKDLMEKWNGKQKLINDKLVNEELRQQGQKEAANIASEIKSLERDMDEFRRRRENQLQEQVMRMRKGLLEDIKIRIEDRAKRDNYDIIFDKSGKSPIGVNFLLFSKDGVDFTDDVLKELNKGSDSAPAASTTPAAEPAKSAPAAPDKKNK